MLRVSVWNLAALPCSPCGPCCLPQGTARQVGEVHPAGPQEGLLSFIFAFCNCFQSQGRFPSSMGGPFAGSIRV